MDTYKCDCGYTFTSDSELPVICGNCGMFFTKQIDVTPKRKDTIEHKYSDKGTFIAIKRYAYDKPDGERINEYVYVHVLNGGPGAIVCAMFRDKTINMLLSNLTVEKINELSRFLSWIETNFWNI
jgi:hypothetical protein